MEYYLREKELDHEAYIRLMSGIIVQACGAAISKDLEKDINDFKAHSHNQEKHANLLSSIKFLKSQLSRKIEEQIGLDTPAAKNDLLVMYCKRFGLDVNEIDKVRLALRYACCKDLNELEINQIRQYLLGDPRDRKLMKAYRSKKWLRKLLNDALMHIRPDNRPIQEDKYVLMLLKGLNYNPTDFFVKSVRPDNGVEPNEKLRRTVR